MKFLPLLFVLVCAAAVHAGPGPITMRVEQVNQSHAEEFSKTQKRSLKVHLANGSAQPMSGLKLKYWIFGREVKDRDVVLLEKGERGADVKARDTEIVETSHAAAKSTEEHYEMESVRLRRGRRGTAQLGKKVEASGTKIIGHAVQLWDGKKLIAEAYEPAGMKEEIGKASPQTKPGKGKKK